MRASEMRMIRELGSHECPLNLEDSMPLLREIRERFGEEVDRAQLERIRSQGRGLAEAKEALGKLQALIENLTAPPLSSAVFYGLQTSGPEPRALVLQNGSRRVVAAAEEVDLTTLVRGDEVFLTEKGVILDRSPLGPTTWGETGTYQGILEDGRVLVGSRDETLIVEAAGAFATDVLKVGDRVRWDRNTWLAYECVPEEDAKHHFVEADPDLTPDQVGGQAATVGRLLDVLQLLGLSPVDAARFGVASSNTILMEGPPGVGKTLLARLTASELMRLTGARCVFSVCKPGEFESPWVGETSRKIRNFFGQVRTAADEVGQAVVFLDEIESIGRIRGGAANQHADKALGALLAEIEGFEGRGNVTIIAATNRRDLLDPALNERFRTVLSVGRPDLAGAREIFGIHLPEDLTFRAEADGDAGEARSEIIEHATSRLYGPGAGAEIARLTFRDGSKRVVHARDLCSGRIIEQIAKEAGDAAARRFNRGHGDGIELADVDAAVEYALESLRTTLSKVNCHAYLSDLPQDVDVVAVETIRPRVKRPLSFLNRSVA